MPALTVITVHVTDSQLNLALFFFVRGFNSENLYWSGTEMQQECSPPRGFCGDLLRPDFGWHHQGTPVSHRGICNKAFMGDR